MSAAPQPKDFFELVKSIGEARSKQEEDRIIADEVVYLKKAVPQTNTPKKKMKELVVRAIYVEMLGQDASFAYIKAVELCASTSIVQKKIGYLASAVCLSPEHEFRFMLVNQIQRDLKSANQLEVSTALNAVCKLVTADMIPAVIGDVVKLVSHESEYVRKRAVSAMHRLYQMDKACILLDHTDKLRRALCDRDPCVMGATLPLFQAIVVEDPLLLKDLVPSFVSILKQITEHRLPKDYDYHRIPAPWMQMNILKILALLGRGDQSSSEGMYEVLAEVMRRADTGINVGYAIVYEVVKTVTSIYPNPTLLDAAATSISRFIRSDSHNLKYIGIKGLAAIVKDHPNYAADHQMAVIDCLEDPDETLKRKTLDLLYRMTNAVNVEFIVEKLLSFLATAVDDHFRADLVGQITQCAERFAPSNTWYVLTVIRVFELAGDKVKFSVAQTLTQLIAEGAEAAEEDEEEEDDGGKERDKDSELRREAVENFLDLIDANNGSSAANTSADLGVVSAAGTGFQRKIRLPDILTQAMAWVLGEYGYLSDSCNLEALMEKLCQLAFDTTNAATKSHIVSALMKLVAQHGTCPPKVVQLVKFYSQSYSLDVQQRCLEFLGMMTSHSATMVDVLPVDASCEDIDVDEDLSFLDSFVQEALRAGAQPYAPPAEGLYTDSDDAYDSVKSGALNITPYERPTIPQAAPAGGLTTKSPAAGIGGSGAGGGVGAVVTGTVVDVRPPQSPMNGAGQLGRASSMGGGVGGTPNTGNQLLNSSRAGQGVPQVWGKKAPEQVAPPTPPTACSGAVATGSGSSPGSSSGNNKNINNINNQSNFSSPYGTAGASAQPVQSPSKPREPTEKERMAAALFGGLGSGAGSSRVGAGSAARANRRAGSSTTAGSSPVVSPRSQQQQQQQVKPATDLLGVTSESVPALSPAPVPVPASGTAHGYGSELLEMDAIFAAAPQAPLSPLSANSAGSPNSSGGMFAGLQTMSPASVPASAVSNAFSGMSMASMQPLPSSSSSQSDVRPLSIVTSEFGRRWGSTPFEMKQSVQTVGRVPGTSGIPTLDALRSAMPPTYHHVESIGATQEAIFAGTATASGGVVLVHVKLAAARRACDVTVKSSARELSSREMGIICSTLAIFR